MNHVLVMNPFQMAGAAEVNCSIQNYASDTWLAPKIRTVTHQPTDRAWMQVGRARKSKEVHERISGIEFNSGMSI